MGRASRADAARHREEIVRATARLLRERGSAISVQDVMAAAGLSHGGFYRHFASKDELLAIAATEAFESVAARQAHFADEEDGRERFVRQYLSPEHRDAAGEGCANAALATEVAHSPQDAPIREAYSRGVEDMLRFLTGLDGDRGRAVLELSTLVGAISLARATNGTPLSDEVLGTVAAALTARRNG
ncbi:TetR/AcrR family transcriptional regulator [Nocardia sp. NRRL S-836]|uniref:TetR/AcrR family transcriptional regulator n=1 Tax=Nocardia sp. NRRL S-836 TaxID=1519492 RepID=UPI0006AEF42D|nr:TetR/AcrR family transcriptional regulator [Nocardia sp. NRRL S-836]